MIVMAKDKRSDAKPADRAKKTYPSRANTKYIGVPADLYDEIKSLADEQERSVSWLARKLLKKAMAEQSPEVEQPAVSTRRKTPPPKEA